MKQIKRAGQSVRSGLSLMCIVCLLCGLLCGFFWLAGESPVLAAGVDGDALSSGAVLSGDASLSAPERDEKLAVQAAAQATFAAGDAVDHKTFGRGTVVKVDGDTLHVKFAKTGQTKKLLKDYAPIVKIG